MQEREKATESFALQAIGWSIIIMAMLYILMEADFPVPRYDPPETSFGVSRATGGIAYDLGSR